MRTDQIHLSDYLAIIRKRKWVVIIFSVVLIGIVMTVSLHTTPTYQATAQIIIERQPYAVTNVEEAINRDTRELDYYQTQYNLLQSRSLASKVIEELQLWKDFQSGPVAAQSEPINEDKTAITDWYLSCLSIEPVRGSRLINISFSSSSAETAARVANTHARAFIEKSTEVRHSGLDWLTAQLKEQKEKVEASQRTIYEYKKTHNITSFEDRQNIVSQKLMDLNAALTKVKSDRLSKQAVYNQLNALTVEDENIFSLPEVAQDSVILGLRNQLIQLKAKQLEMSANYGPKHPKMIDVESRLKQLEQELNREVLRLKKAIKADLDRALAYERSLQQTLDAQKHEDLSLNEKGIQYDVLRQDAQSNQQIYDSLLNQAKGLGLISSSEHSNISLIDEAEVPLFSARPKTFLNVLLSIVVSMFMGPLLAFFFEYMDRTMKTPEDVQRWLGLPVLGLVPYDKSVHDKKKPVLFQNRTLPDGKKYAQHYPLEDISGRFIHNLQVMHQEAYGRVLFVDSTASGEGKTTVLANSAYNFARNSFRVLIIDADIVHPSLHTMFGVRNENGLVNIMAAALSQQLNRGTLETYSVDDLFFLMNLQKVSGTLTITNDSQIMTSLFENGRLLHIQDEGSFTTNMLGTMLVRMGILSENQLEDALAYQDLTKRSLGYILINSGHLTQEQLRGPLSLQLEERLQKLFSWKYGTFVFTPKNIKTYEDEKIYFGDDFTPIINRLGSLLGNRFLEREILSQIQSVDHDLNVSLLPSGTQSIEPYGPIYLKLFSKILDIVKRHFDVILVDTPPVLEMPGVAPLSSLGDGAVFVIKAGNLPFKTTNEAVTSLKDANVNIIGAVLNQVKAGKNYYYKN